MNRSKYRLNFLVCSEDDARGATDVHGDREVSRATAVLGAQALVAGRLSRAGLGGSFV
jgi:hypothetical protein